MGVTKTIQVSGTGARPTRGQSVTIEYTGWLKDTSQPGNRGQEYDPLVLLVLGLLLTVSIGSTAPWKGGI